jgi:flagellar biosynthesis protein FlhB
MDYISSKIPRVNKVCGCCDLKTGNRILAWVLISFHVLGLLLFWVTINESEENFEHVLKEFANEHKEMKKVEKNLSKFVFWFNLTKFSILLTLDFMMTLYAIAATWVHVIFSGICSFFIKGIKEVSAVDFHGLT